MADILKKLRKIIQYLSLLILSHYQKKIILLAYFLYLEFHNLELNVTI